MRGSNTVVSRGGVGEPLGCVADGLAYIGMSCTDVRIAHSDVFDIHEDSEEQTDASSGSSTGAKVTDFTGVGDNVAWPGVGASFLASILPSGGGCSEWSDRGPQSV